MENIGAQIELESIIKGKGERDGLPHAGKGLTEVQVDPILTD